jgi:hypothetical protein
MPFTFSHPAIVLPFCKINFNISITALIIGSIVPDYEFLLQLRELNHIGHSGIGILIIDIPLAYLFCYFFHNVLRNNTIVNLPIFLLNKCHNALYFNWNNYAKENKLKVFFSIVAGILSHLFLDAFTHKNGFIVMQFAILKKSIFVLNKNVTMFFILQIVFSLLGLVMIAIQIVQLPKQSFLKTKFTLDNYTYWISISIMSLLVFGVKESLFTSNNFWSVIIAIMGSVHYAWFGVTIFYKNKFPVKYITTIIMLFIFCCNGFAQKTTQQNAQQKKDSWIQKATEYRKQEDYLMAITQLDSILSTNNKDASILLFKGDLQLQAKQFKKAVATYTSLLPLNFEKTITKINLSYALFMDHKTAKALSYANDAYVNDTSNVNALINYFNALLWNLKTKEATTLLAQHKKQLSEKEYLVLKARLFTTSGYYEKGLQYYDTLVKKYVDKNYVLETAEVMLGKKQWSNALTLMKNNDTLFSKNEYDNFSAKAKAYQLQHVGTEMVYFVDVAKNTRIENSIWWQQKEAKDYRFLVKAGTSVLQSIKNEKTIVYNATLHIDEHANKKISGQTDINAQQINVKDGDQYAAITGKQLVKYQPNDHKMVSVFYSTDILNYTASLFGNNIRSHNFGYNTHILLSNKTGLYSEGSIGALTDKNTRNLIFVSIYRLLRTEPTIKTGFNFSGLHFADNSITKYFSPNSFLNTEVFVDYTTPINSKIFIQTQAATGIQKIEKQKWQSGFRFQAEVGYQKKRYAVLLKYQTSNIAAATGAGYSFHWFIAKFLWKW